MSKPALLAHICCAPDASYVIPLLSTEYDVTGFFYNPNIEPPSEYERRLLETRKLESLLGFPVEEGTYEPAIMSVSPWKDSRLMNRIGSRLARKYGLRFLEADFKKKDGFRKSVAISRRLGLYRQNYCGCRFSQRLPAGPGIHPPGEQAP
ncbi:MAG: epoxyqueuosine reductase QueH [Candidatus Aminicenantes bacterium]|nr:epoxyqueuosine reductase QueH [Candidatus Aminicenantes bacterium]